MKYSGEIAYWIDADVCSWLGPVECAPWRRIEKGAA
jgi:hypothetical protein